MRSPSPDKFWNSYLAGIALGLVLLTSLVVLARGLGASGASWRLGVATVELVAPAHVAATPTLSSALNTPSGNPLDDWLVFEVLGVVMGGVVAAYTSGRLKLEVLRGPRIGSWGRIGFAILGGILMGMAARMARGCTSGQALSGGAMLSVGSWVFMFSVFGGGYALAYFLRREWR